MITWAKTGMFKMRGLIEQFRSAFFGLFFYFIFLRFFPSFWQSHLARILFCVCAMQTCWWTYSLNFFDGKKSCGIKIPDYVYIHSCNYIIVPFDDNKFLFLVSRVRQRSCCLLAYGMFSVPFIWGMFFVPLFCVTLFYVLNIPAYGYFHLNHFSGCH